jgi:hypothetical protein
LLEKVQSNGTKALRVGTFINGSVNFLGKTKKYILQHVALAVSHTQPRSQQEVNTATIIAKLKPCGKEDVYATTTTSGWFVANGVVVSNCDALRYVIMSNNPMRHVSIYDKMNMHIERQRNLTNKAR